MKKSTRNVLIGTGVVAFGVGAVVAASHAIMKKLVTIAMDRPTPEVMEKGKSKLTGSADDVHTHHEMSEGESALETYPCETVEIESQDGLKLVGHWCECENPKRILVAMHGWRSTWKRDFGVIAPFWHDENCTVLYAEQRAQGESEGEYMSFGLLERNDCLKWVDWVNQRIGGTLPVYLAGVSMGATTILMTAADDLPANVHGMIADCGFTSPYAIWKYVVGHNLHIPYNGIRAAFADQMCRSRIEKGTRDYSTVEALRCSTIPVLLIHGEKDSFVPIDMTYENYEACRTPKYLFVVPEAGHGMSYIVDKSGYEEAVKDFWTRFDEAAEEADFADQEESNE